MQNSWDIFDFSNCWLSYVCEIPDEKLSQNCVERDFNARKRFLMTLSLQTWKPEKLENDSRVITFHFAWTFNYITHISFYVLWGQYKPMFKIIQTGNLSLSFFFCAAIMWELE